MELSSSAGLESMTRLLSLPQKGHFIGCLPTANILAYIFYKSQNLVYGNSGHFARKIYAVRRASDIEAEEDDIPVLDLVVLPVRGNKALLLGLGRPAALHKGLERHGLGADEAPLEVGMNLAGRLGSQGSLLDGPGPGLVLPAGQEGNEAEEVVGSLDQLVEAGFLES